MFQVFLFIVIVVASVLLVVGVVMARRQIPQKEAEESSSSATDLLHTDKNLHQILEFCLTHEKITINDVKHMLGISEQQAILYLQELVEAHKLKSIGLDSPARVYQLSKR